MDILTSPLEYEENSFDVDCFESIVHHMISNSIYINIQLIGGDIEMYPIRITTILCIEQFYRFEGADMRFIDCQSYLNSLKLKLKLKLKLDYCIRFTQTMNMSIFNNSHCVSDHIFLRQTICLPYLIRSIQMKFNVRQYVLSYGLHSNGMNHDVHISAVLTCALQLLTSIQPFQMHFI